MKDIRDALLEGLPQAIEVIENGLPRADGKLGATSTGFEESCKKSARDIGIDQEDMGETTSHLVSPIDTL